MSRSPTMLFVPGLGDHVPEHWQTLLAARLPGSRAVAPLTVDKLSCRARVAAIQYELDGIEGEVEADDDRFHCRAAQPTIREPLFSGRDGSRA